MANMITTKIPFTSDKIRETDDIELLRSSYEHLLNAYKHEIGKKVKLEIELERLEVPQLL